MTFEPRLPEAARREHYRDLRRAAARARRLHTAQGQRPRRRFWAAVAFLVVLGCALLARG